MITQEQKQAAMAAYNEVASRSYEPNWESIAIEEALEAAEKAAWVDLKEEPNNFPELKDNAFFRRCINENDVVCLYDSVYGWRTYEEDDNGNHKRVITTKWRYMPEPPVGD